MLLFVSTVSFANTVTVEKKAVNFFTIAKVTQIKNIEFRGITTEDKTFQLVAEQLNKFEINYQESTFNHVLKYMEKYPNTCIRNIVKNVEREKVLIFSQPQTLYLGARVFFSPKTTLAQSKNIDKAEQIDLVQYIKDHPDYVLGIESERSYGKHLDEQIKLIPLRNKYSISGGASDGVLIVMVYNNKVDLILEYPSVIYNASQELSEKPLQSYGIKHIENYQFGYTACSKTEQGQQIINEFNKALSHIYTQSSFFKAHTQWIDESSKKAFQQLFQRLFINKQW